MPTEAAGWMAIGGVATAVVGGLAAAVIRWMHARDAIRRRQRAGDDEAQRKKREEKRSEWRELLVRLQGDNDRQGAVIRQQQQAVEALWRSEADCRQTLASAETCMRFLYDRIKDLHRVVREDCGKDPGDMPDMPELHVRQPASVDFLARQATQSASLAVEASKTIPPPPLPPATEGT